LFYDSCWVDIFCMLMPTFDKRAQWQKKPNNMKKIEKENNKIKTIRPE